MQNIISTQVDQGFASELVSRICQQSADEISYFNGLLNENKLNPANWEIVIRANQNTKFTAGVTRSGAESNSYLIENSAFEAASLLSLALELEKLKQQAKLNSIARSVLPKGNNALDCWFAGIEQTDPESETLALDACLLLYFHQVSRVMFGHCDHQSADLKHKRALDTDADFNAGTMFCLWMPHIQQSERVPQDEQASLSRLVKASYLLTLVLKASSTSKNASHFSATRVPCFFAGGLSGLKAQGKAKQFSDDENDWDQEITRFSELLEAALQDSSLGEWMGNEKDLAQDRQQLEKVTQPIRAELKQGPLKNLAFSA